ncbi:MAG: bifunctional nuclease family protein [Deltaproteobacteria bacterium]
MIEMELNKIVIDEKRHDQLIVLREKNGGPRMLPIVIGLAEVLAIRSKISGSSSPRPLTHDLLFSAITALDARVQSIRIDKLEDNIFFAKLVLQKADGSAVEVDARPSDSIALAVRAKCPIFVEEEVIRRTEKIEPDK